MTKNMLQFLSKTVCYIKNDEIRYKNVLSYCRVHYEKAFLSYTYKIEQKMALLEQKLLNILKFIYKAIALASKSFIHC